MGEHASARRPWSLAAVARSYQCWDVERRVGMRVAVTPIWETQPVVSRNRFFDADAEQPDVAPRIVLERFEVDGKEQFQMLRRLGYQDVRYDEPFVVPDDADGFRSDLTSVPSLFTWLVPRTGNHLPAALLHDGLVHDPGEPRSYRGPSIDREEADRIFRDAMGELGTGRVRRWLMWTAVTMATATTDLYPRWRWIATAIVFFGMIVVLGAVATLDVVDLVDVLPWMGERSAIAEIALGAAVAIVVPLVLAALWGRLWVAGAIAGVALAFLLHVTAVLAALYLLYTVLERVLNGTRPSSG